MPGLGRRATTAPTAIAAEDLDLVICLGDYIYERNFYDGPRKDTIGANGDGEVLTLAEYRAKYRLYRSDEDLRAMHAGTRSSRSGTTTRSRTTTRAHQPGEADAGPARCRSTRAVATATAHSSSTCRSRPPGAADRGSTAPSRSARTAELFLLDQRQYRDDQPCGDELFVPCPEAERAAHDPRGRAEGVAQGGLERSAPTGS